MLKRKLYIFLMMLLLLCNGCNHSVKNGQVEFLSEMNETTLYQQIQSFITDNNLEKKYPEATLMIVEQGADSYLQIVTQEFLPGLIDEIEVLATQAGISVKAASGNPYGIYGHYENKQWNLKGCAFDSTGTESVEYGQVSWEEAKKIYDAYKDYEPSNAVLTRLMVDACRMVYCNDPEAAASKYKFEGGYYFIKYYERIKNLEPVKIFDITNLEVDWDLYELCEYYTAPLDRAETAEDDYECFLYLTGNLIIDKKNYECSLERAGTIYEHYIRNHHYLSDTEDWLFDAVESAVHDCGERETKVLIGKDSDEAGTIRKNIKQLYYAWNFVTPDTWPGAIRAMLEEGNEVWFLYGNTTKLVWNKKTDEVWVERVKLAENADKYIGRYISDSDNVVPNSNMVISKDGETYHVDIHLVNASRFSFDGYVNDGKLILTGTDEEYHTEAELIEGADENYLILKIVKNTAGWLKEGEKVEFYRL